MSYRAEYEKTHRKDRESWRKKPASQVASGDQARETSGSPGIGALSEMFGEGFIDGVAAAWSIKTPGGFDHEDD